MLLGILGVEQLPAVSTFWRYLQSIGHNQSLSMFRLMGVLRERAWRSLGIKHQRIHIDVDTTVETVYGLIQGAKRTRPPFDPKGWYSVGQDKEIQNNSCFFQPSGWEKACRFVAQRIPKEDDADPSEPVQFELFEDDRYKYRIFVTSLTSKPHQVIEEYDGRAGAENLIGEAKREGLAAIPTQKFQSNQAYFQIVMLSYNLWRYMIAFAHLNDQEQKTQTDQGQKTQNTIHVSRLKLLFIAAKIVSGGNCVKVNYSSHLSGKERLDRLIHNLDILRKHPELLNSPIYWHKQPQLPMQKIFCIKNLA